MGPELSRLDEDLLQAARDGDPEAATRLMRAGARVEAADNNGWTSLMWAAWNGHTSTVTELVERHRARVEAADNDGMTSLMYAAAKGHTSTVTELVERHRARVEAADNDGMTSLMYAAAKGHTSTVTELVERHRARVEAADNDGMTSLMHAARRGQTSTVTELVERHGANLGAQARDGRTALDFAEAGRHTSTVREIHRLLDRAPTRSPPAQPPAQPSRATNVRPNQASHDFSHLTLIRQLGEGSFGEVHLGTWNETDVAVKILTRLPSDFALSFASLSLHDRSDTNGASPELAEFLRESDMMAQLRHPNIVQFMAVSPNGINQETQPCIVTEYCARGSLWDVLEQARDGAGDVASELTWSRRLEMALDAARGMLYLHSLSPAILHRDLKSPNMLVTAEWRVKVADFGLSKMSDLIADSTAMSTVQNNNPRWLAPEVLEGGGATAGRPSDVFSFGIVMWELLTWEVPWRSLRAWGQILVGVLGNRRPPVPQDRRTLPGRREDNDRFESLEGYIALMERCWSPKPDQRPEFREIIRVLQQIKQGCGAHVPPGRPEPAGTDGGACIICMDNPLEYAFAHAGGEACMVACNECNARFTESWCPTCRRPITCRFRVFNAG